MARVELEARGLTKTFPGVRALDDVDLRIDGGEVLALIGENGAGKSTLMKILAGIEQPDRGEIMVGGEHTVVGSPRRATQLGIALIHQELNLAENLSAASNIYLGREPTRWGLLDQRTIDRRAGEWLDAVGADFAPDTRVSTLSLGRRQLVEIAKALSLEARVLIMDEPTSSLSRRETDVLFRVVDGLRDSGVSIIYISHRLAEVKTLADRVMVLRDGRNSGELAHDRIEHDAMVQLMVGRDLSPPARSRQDHGGAPVLEADRVRVAGGRGHELDLHVRAGELVGIGGLVGAGRSRLLRSLFGIGAVVSGTVRIGRQPALIRSARQAIDAGLALVPEDRKDQGLFLQMALRANISIAALHTQKPTGWLRPEFEQGLTADAGGRLALDVADPERPVEQLSGGNQQKVVLARWLALQPRVLLLDEPTRGIDVGARQEIYALMRQLAADGTAVLFATSEMEELLLLSDRVLVMHEGRIAGELSPDADGSYREEDVMRLATGVTETIA